MFDNCVYCKMKNTKMIYFQFCIESHEAVVTIVICLSVQHLCQNGSVYKHMIGIHGSSIHSNSGKIWSPSVDWPSRNFDQYAIRALKQWEIGSRLVWDADRLFSGRGVDPAGVPGSGPPWSWSVVGSTYGRTPLLFPSLCY